MDQNKSLRGVAEAVTRIMMGEKALHPNQQKLDVHEPEKDELTAKDFEMLRNKKKMKEEVEDLDEGKMGQLAADLKDLSHDEFTKEYGKPKHHYDPSNFKKPVQPGKEMDRAKALAQRGMASVKKEEVEELDEDKLALRGLYAPGAPMNDKRGGTGAYSYGVKPRQKTIDKRSQELKDVIKDALGKHGPKGKLPEEVEELDEMFPGTPEYEKKYGKVPQDMKKGEKKKTSQGEMEKTEKGVVHKRKFSEMLDVYANGNLKSLFEALDEKEEIIVEEPTNDEFKAELKKAIDKSLGKDKAKVADPAVQAVEVQKEEVELEERQLSASEKAEKEKNVKGMKKNLQGFKDRYGDRAKEVMYATATKQAKGE
jgi:hypothetical protein